MSRVSPEPRWTYSESVLASPETQVVLDRKLTKLAGFGKAASVVPAKAVLCSWRCPPPSTAHLFCPQAMCLLLKKFLFQTMLARDWEAWRPLFLGLEFAVCDFLRGTIPFLLREVMTNPLCKYKTSSNFWCYKRKDRNLVVRGLVYMPSLPKVTLLTPSQWWLRSSCKQGFDAIHVAKLRVYP